MPTLTTYIKIMTITKNIVADGDPQTYQITGEVQDVAGNRTGEYIVTQAPAVNACALTVGNVYSGTIVV